MITFKCISKKNMNTSAPFRKQKLIPNNIGFTTMLLILVLIIIMSSVDGMIVRMIETSISIYDNSNLTIICKAEQSPKSSAELALSTKARMVLTLLEIPRGGQLHQVNGVLHCDPLRTSCESEFNIAVSCVTSRINVSLPVGTIESACQLVDEHICSHLWLQKHRGDCHALGKVTIIKGPKLGESCIVKNSTIDQLLPCPEHQYCDIKYGICQCDQHYIPMNKICVNNHDQHTDSLNLLSSTSSTLSSILPTVTEEPQKKSNNKNTSKALVIFLLIIAILLCIALAVVVIWSRNRSRLFAVGSE